MKKSQTDQLIGFSVLRLCVSLVIFILVIILYDILSKGHGVISWSFLSTMPKNGMMEGGILPAIVGTFVVTIISAVLAVPLGIGCAIFLNEYARDGKLTRLIRMSIRNLSGVPSIVYGLSSKRRANRDFGDVDDETM